MGLVHLDYNMKENIVYEPGHMSLIQYKVIFPGIQLSTQNPK